MKKLFSWIASELTSSTEANAAIDIAIHDLWAKRRKESLTDALGKTSEF